MSKLLLHLLGAPRAESDGTPLVTDTRKATALLAYLAVSGMGHTRDAIAALLWPDLDQVRARAALRRTLSSINAAADATWLRAAREHVELADDGSVWCDVSAFRAAVAETRAHGHNPESTCPRCLDSLERAAQLYRDDFMAGFSLRDSVSFDDWQYFEAEGLRREFADVLEKLVQLHIVQRNWPDAIGHARRRLALDSLHEPAHRQLMLLYAWSGERMAAMRQYQVCSDILARELDVAPLPETADLFQAIKEQREPPPPAAQIAPPPARVLEVATSTSNLAPNLTPNLTPTPTPASQAPASLAFAPVLPLLVGRADSLARLQTEWAGAASRGKMIVLEGEAGIGKTSLAESFLAVVHAAGAKAITTRCYEGEQELTFTPFIQLLRVGVGQPQGHSVVANLDGHWLNEVGRLLPEISTVPVDGVDTGDIAGARARLFEAVAHVLHRLITPPASAGTSSPGILFLDDVQWLDAASLELLAYLVNRLATYPMLLLCTLRSGEAGAEERVRQIAAEAHRRQMGDLISLERLSAQDVALLVQQRMPNVASESPHLAERLYAEAEGLPFFIVEYLAALERAEINAESPWQQPESVRDLLRSRLSRVGEVEQQVLTTAAVVGRSFDFETLRAASGRSEDETLAAIEELATRTLIREIEGGLFDFTHEQLRTVIYESVSLTRRRLLHRRVADALVQQARIAGREISPEAARIAQHYELGAQMQEAARYYYLAGVHVAALRANAEALGYLRRAATLGYGERSDLHMRMGDLRTLMGQYGEALQDYQVALEILPVGEEGVLLRARLLHRRGRVLDRMGEYADAAHTWQVSLDLLAGHEEHEFASHILAEMSMTLFRAGSADEAVEAAERALQEAEASGSAAALSRAHGILSHICRLSGRGESAVAHARSALVYAEELEDLGLNVAALNSLALAYASGESAAPDRAIPLLERALALCVRQGDLHREAALHNNLADLYHLMGDQQAAMDELTQAVALFAEIGSGLGGGNAEIWKLAEW